MLQKRKTKSFSLYSYLILFTYLCYVRPHVPTIPPHTDMCSTESPSTPLPPSTDSIKAMMAGVRRLNLMKNDMAREKKRADMLQEENQQIKAKLLEAQAKREEEEATARKRENHTDMIAEALNKAGINEELQKKRRQDNGLVSPVDNAIAAPPSGKMVRYRTAFLFYYCKVCENYGLCETCFNAKRDAEEINDRNKLRKRPRRGEEPKKGATCDHATTDLKMEDNHAYAPRNRTQNMTGKFTHCFRCGDGM